MVRRESPLLTFLLIRFKKFCCFCLYIEAQFKNSYDKIQICFAGQGSNEHAWHLLLMKLLVGSWFSKTIHYNLMLSVMRKFKNDILFDPFLVILMLLTYISTRLKQPTNELKIEK